MRFKIKIFIGLSLTALLVLNIALFFAVKMHIQQLNPVNETKAKTVPSKRQNKTSLTRPINILVVGSDEHTGDKGRSDTIALYHLDPLNKTLGVLAVPRDTYMLIPGRGMDKVNHAYAFGGIGLSRQTLEKFLGVKIDFYVNINFSGFIDIIDQLGGITIDVEKDILGTDIRKGIHKLNGLQALSYVRDRNDQMGDIARVQRQQRFIKSLAHELARYGPKYKLAANIPQLYKNISTDISLEALYDLYPLVLTILDKPDNIQMEMVPGEFYNYKRISYWKPNKAGTSKIVHRILCPDLKHQ